MEKIKANFSITYTSGTHIEFSALFDNIKGYDDTVQTIENFMDNSESFGFTSIRLIPYNENINADLLSTDILLSLNDLLFIQTSCEVIRYEEPRI